MPSLCSLIRRASTFFCAGMVGRLETAVTTWRKFFGATRLTVKLGGIARFSSSAKSLRRVRLVCLPPRSEVENEKEDCGRSGLCPAFLSVFSELHRPHSGWPCQELVQWQDVVTRTRRMARVGPLGVGDTN